MAEAESSRARLLDEIDERRRAAERYLDAKRPVSNRLTTISVISSCVAAALAAGPAVGGSSFADAVRNGLPIDRPEAVWRLLCLAAVAASVAAAISANLSKSSDLAERVAATEAANGLMDGLRARVRYSRLPVADAAQQYQEIIARVPWVPGTGEGTTTPGRRARRIARRPAPYLLGTTVIAGSLAIVAAVGLVAGLVRGVPAAPVPPDAASPGQASDMAVTPSVVPVARQVFSGPLVGDNTSLAIVVDGGRAAAYLCDGRELEAWFDGEVVDGRVSLAGRNGATITGLLGDRSLNGVGTAKGQTFDFDLAVAAAPAGVYEARIDAAGGAARLGWAVLPGGQQLGVVNRDGQLGPAPPLTLPEATFELGGTTYTATFVSGTDDVVPS